MDLAKMANALRALSIDMIEQAGSGHPGMPLGAADIMTVLFAGVLKHNPANPEWPDRDRFVLSAGHASALLYATLHLAGYPLSIDQLRKFRQLGSVTSGHPEAEPELGIECTTGPLGQGIGMAVGMACAEKILHKRLPELIDHHTWALAGDGCLMEGISHEAAALAGRLRLNKLILLYDDNNNTIDGRADLAAATDQLARFKSYGWRTLSADGHDYRAIEQVLIEAKSSEQPVFVRFVTKIGKFSHLEDSCAAHGTVLGAEKAKAARDSLAVGGQPFVINNEICQMWRESGKKIEGIYRKWQNIQKSFGKSENEILAEEIDRQQIDAVFDRYKKEAVDGKATSTRAASGEILEEIAPLLPRLVGGSADLSGPNCTKTTVSRSLNEDDPQANYIYYGVREHGMGAVMNGMALHGGLIPYGGTFLAFADYMKPAIRLAALMKRKVIYVMTHDTIAIGEDGPTHQPIEQLNSYRALPNLNVYRPSGRIETAEAWQLALRQSGPAMLVLSRQVMAEVASGYRQENMTARGGYLVVEAVVKPQYTLIASGSEVETAAKAVEQLAKRGIECDLVSMPCLELFLAQQSSYHDETIRGQKVLVIEAASTTGWDRLSDGKWQFYAMKGFGASGKSTDLTGHFGYTAERIVARALELV